MISPVSATLEAAILGVPMVIIDKLKVLSWLLGRMLIKISSIGLVNIVAGKPIMKEFIQYDATAGKISSYIASILCNPNAIQSMKTGLAQVKMLLGGKGATRRAAAVVVSFLNDNPSQGNPTTTNMYK